MLSRENAFQEPIDLDVPLVKVGLMLAEETVEVFVGEDQVKAVNKQVSQAAAGNQTPVYIWWLVGLRLGLG